MASSVPYHVLDGYSFLAYPNRDSTSFREFYNIPEARTVVRGSLRYQGNPALIRALVDLGWLDSSEKAWLKEGITWAEIQQRMTGADSPADRDLVKKVDELCTFSSPAERTEVLEGLRWMGLFSDKAASLRANSLDTLSAQLEKLCSFQPGERDLVVLQHKFVVKWTDGSEVSGPAIPIPSACTVTMADKRTGNHHLHPRTVWGPRRLLCHVKVCGRHLRNCYTDASGWIPPAEPAWGVGTLHQGDLRALASQG